MTKYYFFGKDCFIDKNLENKSNLIKKIKQLDFNAQYEPIFLNQIHSNKVIKILSIDEIKKYNQAPFVKADALVTNIFALPICVVTADCLPIILIDKIASNIAIIHAGWRGAKTKIINNTIDALKEIGSKNENLQAIIGPAIREKSYEVDRGFYESFIEDSINNKQFFVKTKKTNHFLFNLPKFAIKQLQSLKINDIKDFEIDTYENSNDFYSYRKQTHKKDHDLSGRNISVVML